MYQQRGEILISVNVVHCLGIKRNNKIQKDKDCAKCNQDPKEASANMNNDIKQFNEYLRIFKIYLTLLIICLT